MHGVTLASRSNHEQAEPFLRAARDAAPEDAQLWLLMAVVYERTERGRDARVARRQASTLLGEGSETGPHYLALAQRLLPYAASPLIDEALERAGGTDTVGCLHADSGLGVVGTCEEMCIAHDPSRPTCMPIMPSLSGPI